MSKYKVELTETVYHEQFTIDAESKEEAESKARELWLNGGMIKAESDLRFKIKKVEDGQHSLG